MTTPRNAPHLSSLITCATLSLTLLALTGCSLFGDPIGRRERPVAGQPAKPKDLLAPIATHRFEIDAALVDVVGLVQKTTVGADDTLPDIARRFNVGYEEILRANPGVDPWLPGAGREIIVPTQFVLPNAPREGIVINVPAMRLYYYPKRRKDEPLTVFTYPIGIGKVGWSTPEGTTKIIARKKDPVWRVPASVRKEHLENDDPLPAEVPPGPDNPLGEYAFTLGWPSYLVHGTNKPYGVGMRSSHGCIRLYPEDIEHLFDFVPIGTPLRVVNQPYMIGRSGDDIVMQSYGALEDDKREWSKARRKLVEKSLGDATRRSLKERDLSLDWDRIEAMANEPRGIPVSVIAADASLDSVLLAARKVENVVPEGSNWDGTVEVDEVKFQELLSDRDSGGAAEGMPR